MNADGSRVPNGSRLGLVGAVGSPATCIIALALDFVIGSRLYSDWDQSPRVPHPGVLTSKFNEADAGRMTAEYKEADHVRAE